MATPASGPTNQPTVNFGPYSSAPGSLQGVGFGLRLLARLLDYGVFYFAIFTVSFLFGMVIGIISMATRRAVPPGLGSVTWHPLAAGFFGYVAYHWICEGLHGSTLGKLVCGIVVVSDNGEPCGMNAAAGRSFAYYVDGLFFGLVGYFSMRESPKQQRLGDKWNDTMVVRRSDVAPRVLCSSGRFFLVFLFAVFAVSMIQLAFLILKVIL
jgi:uncharacterized RDD family membrane protein YckC